MNMKLLIYFFLSFMFFSNQKISLHFLRNISLRKMNPLNFWNKFQIRLFPLYLLSIDSFVKLLLIKQQTCIVQKTLFVRTFFVR